MGISKSKDRLAPQDRYETLKKLAAEGYTRNEAGAKIGLSSAYTKEWINDCAPDLVPIFNTNAETKRRKTFTARAPKVVAYEQAGMTNRRMAQHLGLTASTLQNWRTRHRAELDALKESV